MDKIQQYINSNASKTIQIRAKEILRRGFILDFQYFSGKNIISAVVQGNMPYNVTIKLKGNNPVSSRCNCPYDWPGLCKHEVAVLMKFRKDYYNNEPSGESKRFIKNYEHIDYHFVEKIGDEFFLSMAINLTDQVTIHDYDGDAKLEFMVLDFMYSYSHEEQYVTVEWSDKGLMTTCTCEENDEMCVHKLAVLLYPSEKLNNPGFFKILDKNYREERTQAILRAYGLNHIKNSHRYIKIKYDDQRLYFYFKGKYAGLYPVIPEHLKQITDESLQKIQILSAEEYLLPKPVSDKPLPEMCFGLVFTFDLRTGVLISVNGMTAHLNKKGDNPVSHFKFIRLAQHPDLKDNEKNILEQADKVSDLLWGKNIYNKLPEKLASLKAIFELLDESIFTFVQFHDSFYSDDKLKKKNLQRIKISKSPFKIEFDVSSDKDFIKMTPVFMSNGQRLNISPEKISEYERSAFIIIYEGVLYLSQDIPTAAIMEDLLDMPVKKMVVKYRETFLREVVKPYARNFTIRFNDIKNIQINQKESERMNKKLYISGLGQFVLFRPFVRYAEDVEMNILNSGMHFELNGNQIEYYHRDKDFEREYYEFLKTLHPKFRNQFPDEFFYIDIRDMIHEHWFFSAFEQLRENEVEVLGLNKLKNFRYNVKRANIQINVTSGQDWFDVKVEVAFGDVNVRLADVRKAVMKQDRFIELSDGRIGILPKEWLEKFTKIFRHSEIKGEKLKISNRKFLIVDELFENIDNEEVLKNLMEKKKRLQEFTKIKKTRIPSAIKAELRPYQKEGLNWLGFLDRFGWGGILADDMGLGKTLQILAFLAQQKSKKPSLIVVPKTLIFNWGKEIEKFYPSLNVLYHYGLSRKKTHKDFTGYDLVIASYGIVVRDINWLKEFEFNYVILDESQAIKNPLSLRFKAVSLLKAGNRVVLTGTPIENNTFDLFAQMHFVNPGFFGSSKFFKEHFSIPIDKNADKERAEELKKLISPFILRRTKEQVAKELPLKTEEVLYCDMEGEQRKVYDAYRNRYRNMLLGKIEEEGLAKSKIYVLEGLMKLRQICDSPHLLSDEENYGSTSVKIEELIRNIRVKTGNHKIVVFSQFVSMLGLIKKRLDELNIIYEYLDGSSSEQSRKKSVSHFQSSDLCRVFLISLKAGGTGLNLTAADYVFLVDPWWNPAVEEQAIDRCYRIGQDKKVFAYRMICKNTIEEKIMNYQQRKRAVAADIIQTEESFMKQLTPEDIKGLFG